MKTSITRAGVVILLATLAGVLASTTATAQVQPAPSSYEAENRFAFTGSLSPAGAYVVGQGSVDMKPYEVIGHPLDKFSILYKVELIVGPYWKDVSLVTPQVVIDGFHNANADEDDEQAWRISNLTWDRVGGFGPNGNLKRIRLKFEVLVQGEYSQLTRLGYHYFARGRELGPDGVAEPGPVKPQDGAG